MLFVKRLKKMKKVGFYVYGICLNYGFFYKILLIESNGFFILVYEYMYW